MAKKTPAQRRLASKQDWNRKLTGRGHRMRWKLMKATREEGPYYTSQCRDCPASINVNEHGFQAFNFRLGTTRSRCRGGR
jgi:hypothetical protein